MLDLNVLVVSQAGPISAFFAEVGPAFERARLRLVSSPDPTYEREGLVTSG